MMSTSRHRYAVLTAVATFCLLLAGSLVTSTDSGLAVPDWPLSYGTLFPPMVGGILYEHGHRIIAGIVGLMILVLAVWIWNAQPQRWVRWLGVAAAATVLIQALLGGLTVLLLLPSAVSIAHAMLGQTVFCLTVCLALAASPRWKEFAVPFTIVEGASLRRGGLILAVLAAAQVLFGAIIRHTGFAVGWHVSNAIVLIWLSGWLARRIKRLRNHAPWLWGHAHRLTMLLGVQIVLGVFVWTHRGMLWLRTAHVAVGALVMAQAVVLAWQLMRSTAPALSTPAPALSKTEVIL